MMTSFFTEVAVKFNPFSACAKPARLFLTYLPADIRGRGTTITTTLLPRNSKEPSSLKVKFRDGQEMFFSCDKTNIQGVVIELDRHSRKLKKAADIAD